MPDPPISIAALALQLFGPMQVRVQGQLLPTLRSRTMLWLLALLTLRPNRPVEREWLSGMLWPDKDQSQALANLRPALSGLRSALGGEGERLQSPSRRTLLLDLTGADVDVLAFDAAIASGDLLSLEQAVGLYRGPLLEGCTEEWVFQERNAREQHCLHALQTLGEAALMGGDYEQAGRYYQRAVGIDPWWEAARRGWMEALAKKGDTNAALQVYREFVTFLKDDPKALPDEQTRALYERLRTELRQKASPHAVVVATKTPTPKVTGYLPHPITELVGREDERLEVGICLRRSRLVTLVGPGGIGKTRLAREVANEVVREYRDGVWLVALEALSEGRLVIQQIASVLGLREEPGQTPLQRVTEYLRDKRLLLVLDNCEHLLEASAQVAGHLLQECGEVRILATSREALGITGETVWSVPALAVPDTQHLPQGQATLLRVLKGYESVQLFVERAQAVQKSFDLTGSNARLVAQVCHQLEGIPLAIELAAARIKVLTAQQIAARLNDHLGLLTGGSRTAQPRQQTLRATLDWSYELLTEPERLLLKRLSVFVGGCSLEAAEQVCRGAGVAEGEVLDLLTSLVGKSLVVFEEREAAEGRYRLLEMVRQYAAEGLQASGEAEQIKHRHLQWCLTFAELAGPALSTSEQAVWLARLETEHGNLRAALAWSLKREEEGIGKREASETFSLTSLLLCGALQLFWRMRGHLTEGRAWCEAALKARGAQERTAARAKALHGAGMLAFYQGDYASARSQYVESLAIFRELGNRQGIASSLNDLGIVTHGHGDYAAARSLFEECLSIRRELGDRGGLAYTLVNLGNMAKDQGDYAAAHSLYVESLAIFRELGDRQGIAISLNNLGIVTHGHGDYASARSLYEECLSIRRELGDKWGIAGSLNNLGNVIKDQGDYASARSLFEECLAIFRELGDRLGIAGSLNNLGNVIKDQGDYAAARSLFEECLAICRESGIRQGIAFPLNHLGTLAFHQGDYASARSLYEESLSIRRELGDKWGIVYSLEAFARLNLQENRSEQAAALWGAAQRLRKEIGFPLPPDEQDEYDRAVAAAREALGEEAFAAAWEEGRAMTLEQAVAYACTSNPLH